MVTARLNLARAYYFINVVGRAQPLHWLDMPTRDYPAREDGTVPHSMLHDRRDWKLRWPAVGEPLIWRDTPWHIGSRRYVGHTEVFVEDVLWHALDASFPNQLNALRVAE